MPSHPSEVRKRYSEQATLWKSKSCTSQTTTPHPRPVVPEVPWRKAPGWLGYSALWWSFGWQALLLAQIREDPLCTGYCVEFLTHLCVLSPWGNVPARRCWRITLQRLRDAEVIHLDIYPDL